MVWDTLGTNRSKLNKLILYVYLNSFHLFLSIIQELRNLKIYKILKNFDYIRFSFIFSMVNQT